MSLCAHVRVRGGGGSPPPRRLGPPLVLTPQLTAVGRGRGRGSRGRLGSCRRALRTATVTHSRWQKVRNTVREVTLRSDA